MKKDNKIVLVAIVPRKKDWKILKDKHWYRIPVKTAPAIVKQLKYLAFYQPKIFGEEKWAVNYYTRVKELNIVKRIELLPDEPEHIRALDDYYKFTVGELKRLPHPIPSKRWRRIVFIPTTLSNLMRAKEINDLFQTSPIEEKLYKIMKEDKITPERQFFVREGKTTYCLDFGIFCMDGKINVECDGETYHSSNNAQIRDRIRNNELASYGWLVLRFTGTEINKDVRSCMNQIKKAIKILKGIEDKPVTK